MRWIVELTHETMPARMQPQAEKAVHWCGQKCP